MGGSTPRGSRARPGGGRLSHTLGHTRRAKAAPLAAAGQQQLRLAGVTTEPQKPVRQDTTPQRGVKFALDIGGQARKVSRRGLWSTLVAYGSANATSASPSRVP